MAPRNAAVLVRSPANWLSFPASFALAEPAQLFIGRIPSPAGFRPGGFGFRQRAWMWSTPRRAAIASSGWSLRNRVFRFGERQAFARGSQTRSARSAGSANSTA